MVTVSRVYTGNIHLYVVSSPCTSALLRCCVLKYWSILDLEFSSLEEVHKFLKVLVLASKPLTLKTKQSNHVIKSGLDCLPMSDVNRVYVQVLFFFCFPHSSYGAL